MIDTDTSFYLKRFEQYIFDVLLMSTLGSFPLGNISLLLYLCTIEHLICYIPFINVIGFATVILCLSNFIIDLILQNLGGD